MTTRRAETVGLIAVALSMGTACLGSIDGGDRASGQDPGRVTMRRLNAIEYDNTIRDLLGSTCGRSRPSVKFQFPADEWGDGFFNDGDVLTSSPLTVEKYLAAAQTSIDLALDPAPANAAVRASASSSATSPAPPRRPACRQIVGELGPAGLPPPGHRRRARPLPGARRRWPRARATASRWGSSWRCARCWSRPTSSFASRSIPTPGQTRALTASSWPRACPTSCGPACPTTSCSPGPRTAP